MSYIEQIFGAFREHKGGNVDSEASDIGDVTLTEEEKQLLPPDVVAEMEKPVVIPQTDTQSTPSRNIDLPYMDPSKLMLFTIPKGTILFHGSMHIKTFNPYDIKLGENTLVAYFSPNIDFAADHIMRCSKYPENEGGYIHSFVVNKDITKIKILSKYELRKEWSESMIDNEFCRNVPDRERLNGVGFFFPKKDADLTGMSQRDIMLHNSEFALCSPDEYLDYYNTTECVSLRKMSEPFTFTK